MEKRRGERKEEGEEGGEKGDLEGGGVCEGGFLACALGCSH